MGDLSDLIQKLAYYQAGGDNPGQRSIDKINNIFGTVAKGGADLQQIVANKLALKKAELENQKTQLDNRESEMKLQPFYKTAGLPSKQEEDALREKWRIGQANPVQYTGELGPIPKDLSTTQEPFVGFRESFAKKADVPDEALDMPTGMFKEMKNVLEAGDYVLVNKYGRPTDNISNGFLIPKRSTGMEGLKTVRAEAQADAMADRQQKSFEHQDKMQKRSQDFNEEQRRLAVDPGAKEKFVDLNTNIGVGNKLKAGLEFAKANKINVTGPLTMIDTRFKEFIGTLPKDQQDLLTNLRLNFAKFARESGGTAFTETEKAVFAPIMPREYLPLETNLNRIVRVLQIMNDKKENYKIVYPGFEERFGVDSTQEQKVMTATNPDTGERIQSKDGGKTWEPIK